MDGSHFDWRNEAAARRGAWWSQRIGVGRGVLLMLMIAAATFGSVLLLDRAGVRFPSQPAALAAGG